MRSRLPALLPERLAAAVALALALVVALAPGCQTSAHPGRAYAIKAENVDFAVYAGRTTLRGQYFREYEDDASGDDVTCFVPDQAGAGGGRPEGSHRYFCFDNPRLANKALRLADRSDATICGLEGEATVVISDYTVDKQPNHPRDSATLERVVVSSVGSAQPCP